MLYYNLDPCHFITAADLTWNAGLNFTKAELELFTDVNMYLWIEDNIRGGICYVGKRYSCCNNRFVPETFDSKLEETHIIAVDANNLYGYTMTQSLPIGNFKFLSESEIKDFNDLELSAKDEVGYFLEVDLLYPSELHDLHDFPLAPDHTVITLDMFSPYQKKLVKNHGLKLSKQNRKLTPCFFTKYNYVVHYLNLKSYLEHGMVLQKIHNILSFKQESWLQPYVLFNNDKRQSTKQPFEKDLFKLMNNAWFGKSLQNPRKRLQIDGAFTLKQCQKKLSSPLLENFEIINEEFTVFKMSKKNLCLDKPIYIGFTILELSKLHMYKMYYDYFKKFYENKCSLLYTDTDSLYLEIRAPNVYTDLRTTFNSIMDLSNFPNDHELFSSKNKGVLGALKCETVNPIKEFVALKCKMYCLVHGNEAKQTAKGVKKEQVKQFTSDLYKSVINDKLFLRHQQQNITTKNHQIETVKQNKISLTPFYDKNYVKDDGVNCLPYGHFSLTRKHK
ncbi:hypothetical protein AVEN_223846-1 [Araneus ventricosus]|uniref:DNA-directed DNA polymerase n=1 Tax=Araneus ventricosus TaxID=182803 RepID=A0A4Y2ELF7_ARAVE|nr:hypothetical protein AVEN_223846-1 [Araneus ventricosus]